MVARITVVNDTPDFLDLVHDILEGDRYDTTLIDGDREDALALIRESRPDLLMIDLRLSHDGLEGWDIAQEVRRDPVFAGIPVLVCSADMVAMEELEGQLSATRGVATLRKPFGVDELVEAIERLLRAATPS